MPSTRLKRTVKSVQRNPPAVPLGSWASSRILTSRSAVTSRSIDSFLGLLIITITGWDERYDEEDKRIVIEALPLRFRHFDIDPGTGKLKCPIDVSEVLDNPNLKRAISKVRDELKEGYYEAAWLNQARKATQQRQEGIFDEYLKQHAEELFGTARSPDADEDLRADSDQDQLALTSDGEWSAQPSRTTFKPRRTGDGHASKAVSDLEMAHSANLE